MRPAAIDGPGESAAVGAPPAGFEDILEPRRRELTNWAWALRGLSPASPCRANRKRSPESIKREVLGGPAIRDLLERMGLRGVPPAEAAARVAEILREIGYGRSTLALRVLGYALARIAARTCRGVYVNGGAVLRLKRRMGDAPVVYVPSHRSYADFILMSYVLFHYGIEVPAIAAGMDFHGMRGVGSVLRSTGAFFMRRSYGPASSSSLYWDTFAEYVRRLVTGGDKGVEFFVEGTRSRSGKALQPKAGLLAMLLRPYFAAEVPDVLLVPVSLSYERVMEERPFAFELLGVPKPRETTSAFFRSLGVVRESFGAVYVNFGEPVSAHRFLAADRSAHGFGAVHAQRPTPDERAAARRLARAAVAAQRRLCVVTTFNLAAASWRAGVRFAGLLGAVRWLDGVLRAAGATTDFDGTAARLRESLAVHRRLVATLADGEVALAAAPEWGGAGALGAATVARAVPAVMLQTYVNPLLHHVAGPALVAAAARRRAPSDGLFDEFSYLRALFAREFVLYPEDAATDYAASLRQLTEWGAALAPGPEGPASLGGDPRLLRLLSDALGPFACTYRALCAALQNVAGGDRTEREIAAETQRRVERLLDADAAHPYSLSLDTISNGLRALVDLRIVRRTERGDTVCYRADRDAVGDCGRRLGEYFPDVPSEPAQPVPSKL